MFENEVAVNEWLIGQFEQVSADIPASQVFEPSPGHGHTPVWIVGHLIVTGEFGQRLLGGRVSHPKWLRTFGPGSTDSFADDGTFDFQEMRSVLMDQYRELRRLAVEFQDVESLNRPHGNPIFQDTPVATVAQLITLLLTSHFGFHLAQLSSTRRSAGHKPLF
jgi:hypothetical protein